MYNRSFALFQENENFDQNKCCAFQCDLTVDPLTDTIQPDSVDICSLIFVLSAIHPDKMLAALRNINKVFMYYELDNMFKGTI